MQLFSDLKAAVGFLTRLPVGMGGHKKQRPLAQAAWAFPIAGALIGVLGSFGAKLALEFNLSVAMAALIALGVQIIATGGLHEDGLADCADGFWGGTTAKQRLEIMKDSRIGTYGVLALGLVLAARLIAIGELLGLGMFFGLIAVGALSRVPLIFALRFVPNVRQEGLAARAGSPSGTQLAFASLLGVFLLIFWLGASVSFSGVAALKILIIIASATLCSIGVLWVAKRKIGGVSGDVLGALQQCVELTMLATLAALFS